MSLYCKKPVVVEAVQLRWDTWPEICHFAPVGQDGCRGVWVHPTEKYWSDEPSIAFGEKVPSVFPNNRLGLLIPTLEGTMLAVEDDWIVKGVLGEFYPCANEVFVATYEPVPHKNAVERATKAAG